MRQLWRHLIDEQVAVHRNGCWELDDDIRRAGVPHGIRHVIARRLGRLSADSSAVLHSAAALAAGFDFRTLQAITDLPDEVLLGCLDEAAGAGLIRTVAQPAVKYDFVHPIVRHTLYAALNPDRRARLHRRLAEALERVHAEHGVGRGEPSCDEPLTHAGWGTTVLQLANGGGDELGDDARLDVSCGERVWVRRETSPGPD